MYKEDNKALINWVGRSVQEYIALSLDRITEIRKDRGQYIPTLTSCSVNKSITQTRSYFLLRDWFVFLYGQIQCQMPDIHKEIYTVSLSLSLRLPLQYYQSADKPCLT